MRILLYILLLSQIILYSSCGGCSGYGMVIPNPDPSYESILVLKDKSDTIRSIKYDVKPEALTPNKISSPILLSYLIPTWIEVKTDKTNFRFSITVPISFDYWVDRECDEGGATMHVGSPIINDISVGELKMVRFTKSEYYYSGSIVDTFTFSP